MTSVQYHTISRRQFLKATGLITTSSAVLSISGCANSKEFHKTPLFLDKSDNKLRFVLPRSEMGQDISTSFAMIIAEEMDCPLDIIQITYAKAGSGIGNRMTVASSSIKSWWMTMRMLGASTKQLLIQHAAIELSVPATQLSAENGYVAEKSGERRISYEELFSTLPISAQNVSATLKNSTDFKLIGQNTSSISNIDKVRGTFEFHGDRTSNQSTLKLMSVAYKHDWNLPNKAFVSRLKEKYALSDAFGISENIGPFSFRVFLAHKNTWPLLQAKKELEESRYSQGLSLQKSEFDTQAELALSRSSITKQHIKLEFTTTPLAHAPMEAPCASAIETNGRYEFWAPTQAPNIARKMLAKRLAISEEHITVNTLAMGGSFGRKRYSDFLEELAIATKALSSKGISSKIELIWTREDDLSREFYRPATIQKVQWQQESENKLSFHVKEGFNLASASEVKSIKTDLPLSLAIEASKQSIPHHFSSGIWRAVQHGYHAFALCSTVDEICAQQNQDPVSFYLNNLKQDSIKARAKALLTNQDSTQSKLENVIEHVKQKVGWTEKSTTKGYGFAAYSVFGSHIAVIAKVSISSDKLKIEKIWASVDCGLVINPDKLKAQVEGGLLYGLSAALMGNISSTKDRNQQNFHTIPALRINQAPDIEVIINNSDSAPSGAGELGVPPIAPAICNAIRGLTGQRFIKLPFLNLSSGKLDYSGAIKAIT